MEWGKEALIAEGFFGNISDSQSHLDRVDGSDSIGAVSVGDSGILFGGIVTEQKHFLAIKGVSGPGNA